MGEIDISRNERLDHGGSATDENQLHFDTVLLEKACFLSDPGHSQSAGRRNIGQAELLHWRPGVPHIENPENKIAYEKYSRSENCRSHSSPPSIPLALTIHDPGT